MHTTVKINDLIPGEATHPGEILKDELDTRRLSQTDFAKQIGYQKSQLNEILSRKRGINADLALLLQETLKIDAEYWMNAQKMYELDVARINKKNHQRLEAITQWKMIEDYIPTKFFKAQGVISGDPLEDIPTVKEIYKITTFEEFGTIYANGNYQRFRKSEKLSTDKINLVGWVRLVEYRADQLSVSKFDYKHKDDLIKELNLALYKNKNLMNKVSEVLKEAGIKIVYQEKYEKTPVDGVSLWSDGNPAIGMSLRHKRIDNFAFTLFHELGHVYLHLLNDNKAEFIDLNADDADYKKTKEEKEANEFASENLINKASWKDFSESLNYRSDAAIKKFSSKVKVNPAIIRGRVCHETKDYSGRTSISYDVK